MVLIPGLEKSPGEGNGTPLQYSCLGNPMDKRSLAGYSPWGRRVGHDLATKLDGRVLATSLITNYDPAFPVTQH